VATRDSKSIDAATFQDVQCRGTVAVEEQYDDLVCTTQF
jgi:hypothetical protein